MVTLSKCTEKQLVTFIEIKLKLIITNTAGGYYSVSSLPVLKKLRTCLNKLATTPIELNCPKGHYWIDILAVDFITIYFDTKQRLLNIQTAKNE